MAHTPAQPHSPFGNFHGGGGNRLLKFTVNCPACEQIYDIGALRIVGESDQSLLTHIVCERCGTAVLTFIAAKQGGVTATRMVTDLTPDEVPMLEDQMVHEDDVLEFYTGLEDGTVSPSIVTTNS